MIVIDTHVLVWLDEGNSKLGTTALAHIDHALGQNKLAVSAISFWEVAMLTDKGRLDILMDLYSWRLNLLKNGIVELPVDGEIGLKSAVLPKFHGDPADRIIVASSILNNGKLITADRKILAWSDVVTIDARL